jgi:competence protein ComEC
VLKVAHHGSAYFDPDFVAATHARLAVISVGAHNDYGHPSPLALAALARDGMTVARTDQDGDVAVVGTASGLRVVEHGIAARAAGPGLARAPPSLLDRQPGRLIAQLR